jgi:hypothetical protein
MLLTPYITSFNLLSPFTGTAKKYYSQNSQKHIQRQATRQKQMVQLYRSLQLNIITLQAARQSNEIIVPLS